MKRRSSVLLSLAVLVLIALGAFFFYPAPLPAVSPSASMPGGAALVERGRYLATASDCAACHTAPGGKAFAGGLAFQLPFGTLYSSNITPDPKHGIGSWSDAQFVRAVRHGVAADGKELYPAFPYTAYKNMSTDDVLAIRVYLRTVPAIAQERPVNKLSFPFNMRALMRGWKVLNMPSALLQADPTKSVEWNRGAYLVEGPGHCAECHTPRNMTFGLDRTLNYAGAVTLGWKAYNLTSDPNTGIGNWSVDELARYLGTGHAPGHGAASGMMAEAVSMSLSQMTQSDIRAMAVYLKSIPARTGKDQPSAKLHLASLERATPYKPAELPAKGADTQGLRVFEGFCASCHAWNGKGLQTEYAALQGARTVSDPDAMNLLQVILHGSKIKTSAEAAAMPHFGEILSDSDIAAVSNYVLQNFGGQPGSVTPERVARARKEVAGH
jgi:mono/diheme cytochrome c family protein